MGILNRASDGLPSVLIVLARTASAIAPMARSDLEALVTPSSLDDGKMVRQTLNRWIEIGFFAEIDGKIRLCDDYNVGAADSVGGLRLLGDRLRDLVLEPQNNLELLYPEPSQAADFTHALCWMLTQDPYFMTTGNFDQVIDPRQIAQIPGSPKAFQNNTRWNGFLDWAPLLGFGWTSQVASRSSFMIDPTEAVATQLPGLFGGRDELTQAVFLSGLASLLPVVDGGDYRRQVEARIQEGSWHAVEDHEVSPSLSLALLRLEASGRLRLEERSDAVHRDLLGRGFRPIRRVSHLILQEVD